MNHVRTIFSLCALIFALQFGVSGQTEEQTAAKTMRQIEDKTCTMINGKMQCAGKKMKHKMQNISDDMKAKELREKESEKEKQEDKK